MAGFVIEIRGGRLFIRREFMASEEVEISPAVADIICTSWRNLRDGAVASVYVDKMHQRMCTVRKDTEARRDADKLAAAITRETGVDNIFSESQKDNRSLYRTMIAYRLRMMGYGWPAVVGAVGRNVSTLSRLKPGMFVSSNPDSLWMRINREE